MPTQYDYKGWKIVQMLGYWVATKDGKRDIREDTSERTEIVIDCLETPDLISCPFCGEKEFDKIGLKHHLINGYCEEYLNTQSIERKF